MKKGPLARKLGAASLALLVPGAGSSSGSGSETAGPIAPAEHRRGAEQTYLTFPEWFLVHSPAEYADHVATHPPSGFPFLRHVGQFWKSYAAVTRATRKAGQPFNFGYHVMIVVIGVSTTIEYTIRSAWENVPGRLAELTAAGKRTAEDEFGARVAREYVDFIRVKPWYEFDFWGRLKTFWKETSLGGPSLIRKWERKYALTSEYGVKALYGWVIRKATKTAYDEALPTTAVVLNRMPPGSLEGVSATGNSMKVVQAPSGGAILVTLPRYEAFLPASMKLANAGVDFREIAGNGEATPILVSVLAPTGWRAPVEGAVPLFTQFILTRPGSERVAFTVPVGSLAELLRRLDSTGVRIEHVYDY